jgi:hypothetical protein
MDETKIRYLEMIQSVINRMASNSFLLKGWSVTLVTGILSLTGNKDEMNYFLLVYIPIIVFWLLDAYYLQLERKYRRLFEKVRDSNDIRIPFEMNLKRVRYLFNNDKSKKKFSYIHCLFSPTEFLFYVPVAVAILIILKLMINI